MHSLHGYFVRPGDPTEPIRFTVETIRDGRSFSVRRSTAEQHGKTIFFMSASFQVREEGLDHHTPAPLADVPAPEDVPTMADWVQRYPSRAGIFAPAPQAVDVRYVGVPGWVPPGDRVASGEQRVWMRIDGKLPDDPLIHACALTYASDLSLLDSVLSVHGEVWGPGGVIGASLDHALWLHRPFRADEWFLYDCTSPSASGSRGLARGACSPATAGTSPAPSRRACSAASAHARPELRVPPGGHRKAPPGGTPARRLAETRIPPGGAGETKSLSRGDPPPPRPPQPPRCPVPAAGRPGSGARARRCR